MSAFRSDTCLPAVTKTQPLQNPTRPDRDRGSDPARREIARSATVVIAVTLQHLVEEATRFWPVEERLVLDALRRSTNALRDADTEMLADYVASLTPAQLRGVVSNVKGIYHELLFVHAENIDADEVSARVFEATNHPGADVEFLVEGETIGSVQLKAVASPDAIYEHLARYPDIEVVATEEVAARIPGTLGSGFFNEEITGKVTEVFSELPGDTLIQDVAEGIATSALVSGALSAAQVLRSGKVSRQQFATAFGDMSVGIITAAALNVLMETVG